jgi:hypothetical protein
MKYSRSRIVLTLFVAGVSLMSSGCAGGALERVKPWERGPLADYAMRVDRDPLERAMAEHMYFSRESATGGRGVGGSGCGCN